MTVKRIWLIIPTLLLPYIVLAALGLLFGSSDVPFLARVMAQVFADNAWYLLGAVCLIVCVATGLSVFMFIQSLIKRWDALSLAKTAAIIKCLQIPAYVLIFVLGVVCMVTIFTAPFALVLCLLDSISVFLTGLLSLSAIIEARRRQKLTAGQTVFVIVSQCLFVVDVIGAVWLWSKLKTPLKNGEDIA